MSVASTIIRIASGLIGEDGPGEDQRQAGVLHAEAEHQRGLRVGRQSQRQCDDPGKHQADDAQGGGQDRPWSPAATAANRTPSAGPAPN